MNTLISQVFDKYCAEYKRVLQQFTPYPDQSRHSLHEVNQVATFQKIYEQERRPKNVITWLELGVKALNEGNNRTSHIDGFIADMDKKTIIFIEAKRLSRDKNICGLCEDLTRVKKIKAFNINGPDFQSDTFSGFTAYCVLLADFCNDHHHLSSENMPLIVGKDEKETQVECSEDMKKISLCKPRKISDNYYLMYALHEISNFK